MRKQLFAVAILAVSAFSFDASAQRRDRGFGSGGITVFEHPDYRGDSVSFRDEVRDLRRYGLNDRISSLDINGNQTWEVCQDVDFGGRCRTFAGSVDDLREAGWNDRISSMRVVGAGRYDRGRVNNGRGWGWGNARNRRDRDDARIVLYEQTNFRGDSRDVTRSTANLGGFDRARSVEVHGGTWQLCAGAFRNARCVTVDRDVRDLRDLGLRNGIDSVRALRN